MSKHVAILGGGLAGLSAAWVLSKNGYEVTVLEKTAGAGGLAVTKQRGAYAYDLGPHNIHTLHGHILTFLRTHLGGQLFEHTPTAKVYKRGKLLDYPLRGIKVLTSLPRWKLPLAAGSFMAARVRMFTRQTGNEKSFEAWIANRFGRLLFNEYFGPYAAKVWGTTPDQIDKYVAEKRVPVLNLAELVRSVLFGKVAPPDHPDFLQHNYYLRHGIGETVKLFLQGAEAQGVQFHFETSPHTLHSVAGAVRAVSFADKQGKDVKLPVDYVLSTIPLNEAVRLFPSAPADVQAAAEQLDYCATVLLYLCLPRTQVLPTPMLYFNEGRTPISRIYDVGMYSPAMVPEGCTMLCVEFPCSAEDATWNADDADLTAQACTALQEAGVLTADEITDSFTERVSHSYPRFRVGFQERVATVFKFFNGHDNLISYGRQGGFAYVNTDHVMHLGFKAASAVMVAPSMGYRCAEWFHER